MVTEGHSQMVTEGHISKFHLGAYYTYFKHQLLVLINVINYNSKILEHLLLLLGIFLQLYLCSCHIKLVKLSVDFVYAICEKVPIDCLKSQKLRVNESKTLYSYVKLQIFVRSTINCCLKYIFLTHNNPMLYFRPLSKFNKKQCFSFIVPAFKQNETHPNIFINKCQL